MKAVAVRPADRFVGLVDHPEPRRERDDQVLLRVLEVGICGTDREIGSFDYGEPPRDEPYLVIGHEGLCEVLEAGPAAEGLAPGDLVVPMVRRPCAHEICTACREGRADFCYTGDYTERGIKGRHGWMAERIAVRAPYLVKVPAALRDVGVLAEPLSIAEKALAQIDLVQRRLPWHCRHLPPEARPTGELPSQHCHRALVIGAGPVGILGAMALRVRGYQVFVYSRETVDGPKAAVVRKTGATYLSAQQHHLERFPELIGNLDVVYEAAGASQVAFDIMRVLGTNGVFSLTGVPGRKASFELDADTLMQNVVLRNQLIFGTVNADRAAFARAVRDLAEFRARWPEALSEVITARHPPEEAAGLVTGGREGIKSVVAFAGGAS